MIDSQRGAHIVDVADVGEDALLVHDETRDDPSVAFMLSRLARGPQEPTPIGVFRDVVRPDYGEGVDPRSPRPRPSGARATWRHCCARARPGTSTEQIRGTRRPAVASPG